MIYLNVRVFILFFFTIGKFRLDRYTNMNYEINVKNIKNGK